MSEGWSSAQPNKTLPQASPAADYTDVQEDPFAVALTGLVLGASQAEAGYGYGYGDGYNHYRPPYGYSYSHCYREPSRHHPRLGRLFLLVLLQDRLSRLQGLQLAILKVQASLTLG